ncbi:basic-leucine zipper transcription factor f-related [Anaeramoeba flamelloides]|uniref:Basic-leucine zipper transcription factor f-related n=1 Tax=Anaeramoeba flamelloides TaxID=1746091 RepID=A0AAV7YZP0_9EUKA|nr:basic-leucine zipper transcription factor f-related [Anaeramoeba flamelloides]
MEFGRKNNEYPFFGFVMNEHVQDQEQDQLNSNLLLPYSDFDQGFKWDFTSFENEEKATQPQSINSFPYTITNTNQLQFEQLPPFAETNMINFPQATPNSNNVFEAQQVQDLSALNSTKISKIKIKTKTNSKKKKKIIKKNIKIKKKIQRKRRMQEAQETLPKEPEQTNEIKTEKKPEIKKKQTDEQAHTNQAEPKKRAKKVDWLNLGVSLSEKEKTLLNRLSGKKNRELSKSDRLEWKRLRDRISARHSRQKKKAYLTNLESKVSTLQKEKSETDQKLSSLELENKSLREEINKLKQIVQIRLQNCSNQSNLPQLQINNEPPNKQRTLLKPNNTTMIGWMN